MQVLPRAQTRSNGFVIKRDWSDFGSVKGIMGKVKRKNAHPCQRPLHQRLTFPWSIARYTLIARSHVCFQTLEKPRKKEGASEIMWCHGDNPSPQQCRLGSNPGIHRFESWLRCFSLSDVRDMLIISSLQRRESWYLIKFTVVNSRCHRMFVAHYPILYFRLHHHQCQLQTKCQHTDIQ